MEILAKMTNNKRIAALAAVVLLAMLFLAGRSATARAEGRSIPIMGSDSNMTSPSYNLDWDVVGSGGGTMSSSSYTIKGTSGQPALGTMSSTSYEERSGFWVFNFIRDLFLPLIMRN